MDSIVTEEEEGVFNVFFSTPFIFLFGFILGIFLAVGAYIYFAPSPPLEYCAELFCGKDGEALVEYDSQYNKFTSISCSDFKTYEFEETGVNSNN